MRDAVRIVWGLALLVATCLGCARWELVQHGTIAAGQARLEGSRVRFSAPSSPPLVVDVRQVQYPYAIGWDARERQWRTIDLEHAASIEVREIDGGATAGLVAGSVLGGLAIVALAYLALLCALSSVGGHSGC